MKSLSLILLLATMLLASLAGTGLAQNNPRNQADPYAQELPPLSVAQCGQCHPGYFKSIRDAGGRHRFACTDCHQQFHAYNPIKNNWAQLMPKCDQCHQQPHGSEVTDCLKCHTNPHTPLAIAMDDILLSSCGKCHAGPSGQLAEFPSKHTQLSCAQCHTKHGLIPSCMECHTPHVANQAVAACLACHPVHKPLQITYDAASDHNPTCGSCHSGVLATWQGTRSLHGKVSCAQCHTSHGFIPKCSSCHGLPHGEGLLDKFPDCLNCHIDVHDLPTKR